MAAALFSVRPTVAGIAFACSACAAFFVHEPWLVLRGQRGSRALREDGQRAKRLLFTLVAVSGISGGVALALTGLRGLEASALPLVLSIAVAILIRRGAERTLLGEIVAAAALSSLALPVAIADGVPVARALATVAAWTAIFGVGTAVVRGVVSGVGHRGALPPLAVFLGASVLYLSGMIELVPFVAIIPGCLVTGAVALLRPKPQKLRRVGWVMAGSSLLSAAVLAFG